MNRYVPGSVCVLVVDYHVLAIQIFLYIFRTRIVVRYIHKQLWVV